MGTEKYNVEARLELASKPAVQAIDSITKKLGTLQGGVQKVNVGFDGLITKAVAFGGAYFGINALVNGFRDLAGGILEANAEAESMQASLATIYAAVEKVSFKQATDDAGALFRILEKTAILSTATAPELMTVFQGVYGPLRNAGLAISDIVTLTNNAAVTASALGVDFAQASRDISAMARGTAGLDVKTFSLLQSMGMIKETTEEWNKLAPEKRAKKLMDVMNKIGGQAAEAYGRTWKGLSSTFSDIMGAFKRAFGSAVFERMKSTLERINKHLLDNRTKIESYLRALGERVGGVFDMIINNAGRVFRSTVDNIDKIRNRVAQLYDKFLEIKPMLVQGAKVALALQVASIGVNAVVPLISAVVSGFAFLLPLIPVMVAGVSAMIAKLAILGVIFSSLGAAGGMAALWAAISAGLAAFGAAIVAVMWPILAIVAVIVGVIVAFRAFKDSIMEFAAPLFASMKSIGDQMAKVGKSLWNGVKPVLELFGGVIIFSLIAAFRTVAFVIDVVVMPVLRVLASIVEFVGSILKFVFDNVVYPGFNLLGKIVGVVTEALGWLGDKVKGLVAVIADAISWISKKIGSVTGLITKPAGWLWDKVRGKKPASSAPAPAVSMGPKVTPDLEKLMRLIPYAGDIIDNIRKSQQDEKDKAVLRRERPVTHNDFRGSKITVKQEFREADPDRVWVQFRKGLEQEATARTRSGFADALAR